MWCRCKSTKGYLYKFDEYLDKKDKCEFGLDGSVVLNVSEKLEGFVLHSLT